jgi:hypothetical protein
MHHSDRSDKDEIRVAVLSQFRFIITESGVGYSFSSTPASSRPGEVLAGIDNMIINMVKY